MYLFNSALFGFSSDFPLNKRYSSYEEGMCVYMQCLLIFLSSPKSKRMQLSLSCLFLQYYSFFFTYC